MEKGKIAGILEALIFTAGNPVSWKELIQAMPDIPPEDIRIVLGELIQEYQCHPDRGLSLIEVAGGYQFRTKAEFAPWVQRLNLQKPARLSRASLETLAIIAYRQPVMKSEVDAIRGVESGGVIQTLCEKNLVRILGRKDTVGRPLIYGTTPEFLEIFGLKDLSHLPTLKEIEE
jgi:segregation and condensation protein B